MSRARIADLLQEIGAVLLIPGLALEGGQRPQVVASPDLQAALDGALQRLSEAPTEQLDIAYAGLFMHGFEHPTLHLEESVMRCGELRSPAVLASLQDILEAAGVEIMAPYEADHLGAMASLLGHVLHQLDEQDEPVLQAAAQSLLHEHLRPLQAHVSQRMEQVDAHPYFRCVIDLLGVVLGAAEGLLPSSKPQGLAAEKA